MTLRQLRYVDVIAKRGSLTAAAEVLFVTQRSSSRDIFFAFRSALASFNTSGRRKLPT